MKPIFPFVAVAGIFAFARADPVCIVGAGPAGLTVANRLQAKGFKTVIFEKNPEVGGKCQAYYDELSVDNCKMASGDELMADHLEAFFTLWGQFCSQTRPTGKHYPSSIRRV
jgi:monoamine oxidase